MTRISSPIVARDAELLHQLAREAGVVRLAGLALAAGKLPQAGEVRALEPARHEEAAVALDDGGEDDDRRAAHQRSWSGLKG